MALTSQLPTAGRLVLGTHPERALPTKLASSTLHRLALRRHSQFYPRPGRQLHAMAAQVPYAHAPTEVCETTETLPLEYLYTTFGCTLVQLQSTVAQVTVKWLPEAATLLT